MARSRQADRVHLRAWLARFACRDGVAFAMEGCTGWRYVAGELAAAGIAAHVGEPADTAAARGRKRHAKTGKTDSRHLRVLLAEGRCRSAGSRRRRSWSAGRCWRPITTCAASTPPGRSCAVFFRQGAPALGEGALRTGQGLAGLRAAAAAYLSPGRAAAGRHRPGHARRHRGPHGGAAHPAARRRPASDRGQGAGRAAVRGRAGHRAGADLLAGRGRPVLLLGQGGPVHRAGHHRLVLGRQRPARAAVPAGTAGAALGGLSRPARPTPALRPPATPATPPSRTARTASAPPCPRPARSSGRPATS